MKPASFLIPFLLVATICSGQFNLKVDVNIPDTLSVKTLEWVDADNDSLLDIMIVAKAPDSTYAIFLYKNVEANTFTHQSVINTGFNTLITELIDYDLDNAMDIMVSGNKGGNALTSAFLNKGSFQFELMPDELLPIAASLLKMDDLDRDGRKELILSGGDVGGQINIYRNTSSGWTVANDSIKVNANTFVTGDFDGDLNEDIFVSGSKNGSPFTAVLYNEGYFYFSNALEVSGLFAANAVKADFNYDGTMDLLIPGDQQSKFLVSDGSGGFVQRDTLLNQFVRNVFAGDLNSDGRIDFNILGLNESAQPVNIVKYSSGETLTLPVDQIRHQRFGDSDRDGDLDLLQLEGHTLKLLENKAPVKNNPPGKPSELFATMIFDRLFAYWNKSTDDHTPQNAITYDLTLQSQNEEILVGDFDLFNKRRTLVSSGNNESHNFTLLKNISPTPFGLYVQSVDNAYHAGGYGVCKGNGESCTNQTTVNVTKCGAESLPLTADGESLWFSFNDGYLGTYTEYQYDKRSADTVFAFTPGSVPSCSSLKVFLIQHAGELIKKESITKYVCEETSLTFGVEQGWAEIKWSSSLLGNFSNDPQINYVATKQDTIIAELTDNLGCTIQRETIIVISKPEISLTSETYQILKGESVQLNASGGSAYQWQPSAGLNDPTLANPTATPQTTTEYQVTAFDSLTCSTQAKVLVIVEETAFIPNLFTPNEDGKNDALKIYGLSQAKNFSLSIYNREGSIVYKTTNVQEAINTGWNGTVSGVLQPAGVYQWKVQGEYSSGKPLLLNGKETGSIILIR